MNVYHTFKTGTWKNALAAAVLLLITLFNKFWFLFLFFFFFSILRSLIHDSCKLLETEHEAANVCSQFVSIGRSFRANQSWKKLEIFNFGDVLCFYCTILGNDGIQAVLLHRAAGNLRHWVPLSSLFVPFYVWYETWFSNFSRCFS